MLNRATASVCLSHLFLHAILGKSNQIYSFPLKTTTSRKLLHYLYKTSKLRNPSFFFSTVTQNSPLSIVTKHHLKLRPTMSSTNVSASSKKTSPDTNPIDQSTSLVTHASTPIVPLRVDLVSTVFPDQTFFIAPEVKKEKSKKKKSATTAVKKTPKL
jgi:hypothetical protein